MLERIASFLEPMLMETPPNPWSNAPGNLIRLAQSAWNFRKLGVEGKKAIEILTGAANPILDRWFESEEVKTTISTDAIIGAFATPPCRAPPMFFSIMSWANATACAAFGATCAEEWARSPMPSHPPPKNAARKSRSTRLSHESSSKMARPPASSFPNRRRILRRHRCLWPRRQRHLPPLDGQQRPSVGFRRIGKEHLDYSSASCKINLALSEVPNFTCLPGNGAGPQHHGTIHISPNRTYIEKAYDCAKYGYISENPVIEATMPSSLDDTSHPKANT